jgi:hypothetical protein
MVGVEVYKSATVRKLAAVVKPVALSLFCPSPPLRTRQALNSAKDCIRSDKDKTDSLLAGHFHYTKAKVHRITDLKTQSGSTTIALLFL